MTVEEIIAPFVKKDAKRLTDKLEKIKERFKTSGITSGNISAVLLCVIVEVDKIKKLKGSEKKQLVVALLNNIIEDVIPGEDVPMELILKEMVPTMIDNLVEMMKFSKGCMSCIKQ